MEEKKTLSRKAESYIRNKIMNGELQPHDKIVELDIAKEMNVSRGPVREALKTLMFEGLVDYETNKGCSVTTLSPVDAYEVFFMRGSLEKIALEKCAGKLTDEAIFKMEAALEEMNVACEQGALSQIIATDEMFHQQIIELGRMNRLTKMWQMLSPLNGAMFLTVNNAKKIGEDIFNEPTSNKYFISNRNAYESHRDILKVLKVGVLEESCKCLDAHYTLIGEKIYKVYLREETKGRIYL